MARAHLRARHSLLRPSAPWCLSRRSWRHGNLYASSQSPAAGKSHRSRERENKKGRKQFPPRGRGCHGAIKRLWGWGVVEPAASPKASEKGWREKKKIRLFIYFSLETSAMFGTRERRNNVAPVVVVSPLFLHRRASPQPRVQGGGGGGGGGGGEVVGNSDV